MTEGTLLVVTYLGILLLAGLICSIISKKLKMPNILLLILAGMLFSAISYKGQPIFEFPPLLLTSLAIITLAMIVFDSSSKFRFAEFDSLSASAMKLSIIFLLLNLFVISITTYYLFSIPSILLSIIFAAVISGTDPSPTVAIMGRAKSKIFEFLKVEAVLNTPLIVLIPFLIIDILKNSSGIVTSQALYSQAVPFAQQFVVAIGTGVFVSLISLRYMKRYYNEELSSLAVIVVSLLTYALSEVLGGNGVLGVTTAGIMFGNLYKVKHIQQLRKFEELFSTVFEVLVFILIGFIIKIKWASLSFMLPATLLFLLFLCMRFLSIELSFAKQKYTFREKLYMTLNIPKGISVAIVVFTLATSSIEGMSIIVDLTLLFLIYTVILSAIITRYTKYFTKVDIK